MIEVTDEGHRGFVEDITMRYTKIFTLQNTFIVISNSEIQQRDVINYSAEDERTRISVAFEITYESDLEAARRHAERSARGVDNVISGGPDIRIGSARYAAAPVCTVQEYADNGFSSSCSSGSSTHTNNRSPDRQSTRPFENGFDNGIEFAYPTATTFSTTPAGRTAGSRLAGDPDSGDETRERPSTVGEPTVTRPERATSDDGVDHCVWDHDSIRRIFYPVPVRTRDRSTMYDDVLVPTDGSDTIAETLTHGLPIAVANDATVHALYVVDSRITAAGRGEQSLDRTIA